jgi:HNH endonuclease
MRSFRVYLARAMGIPKGIWRRIRLASRRVLAPSNFMTILQIRARWLGILVTSLQTDMDNVKHNPPVGQCVYCGKREPEVSLSREHILAYSLGGDAVLPAASCPTCQEIIRPIETYCAETVFKDVRVHHGVHSRSGQRLELPVYTKFSPEFDDSDTVLVSTKDHPGLLMMPSYDLPGIVSNIVPSDKFLGEVKIHGWEIDFFDDDKKQRLAKAGIKTPWVMRQIDMHIFGRMIAKVAHCTAIGLIGFSKFKPLLKEAILEGKNVPYFVGCATDRTPPPIGMKTWARIEIRKIRTRRYVVVFLRLFAYVKAEQSEKGTPVYSVVVGEFIPWWARLGRYIGWPPRSIDKIPALGL